MRPGPVVEAHEEQQASAEHRPDQCAGDHQHAQTFAPATGGGAQSAMGGTPVTLSGSRITSESPRPQVDVVGRQVLQEAPTMIDY